MKHSGDNQEFNVANNQESSCQQVRNRTNINGGQCFNTTDREKTSLITTTGDSGQSISNNRIIRKRSFVLIFISYMVKALKKMSFLFEILNPSKKGRLPPIKDDILMTPANELSVRIKQGQVSSYHY